MTPAPWEPLDFDTAFFGCRIARVTAPLPDAAHARELARSADAAGVACLYALLDAGEAAGLGALEDAGFRVVDVRLTLARPLAEAPGGGEPGRAREVRLAEPSDLPGLQAIARESHRDSRFWADPHFPRERCGALYARWIERKCLGGAAAVFVLGAPGAPEGYLSCDLNPDASGQIDLIGIAESLRRRGRASALTCHALAFLRREGRERALVVTQGRNSRALRHFGRHGFATARVQLWLHRWREGARAGELR